MVPNFRLSSFGALSSLTGLYLTLMAGLVFALVVAGVNWVTVNFLAETWRFLSSRKAVRVWT